MEPGRFSLFAAFIIYTLFCDPRLFYILLVVWIALFIFHAITPAKYNSTRRKLMIGTWDEPREGVIISKYEADLTHLNEFIKESREKTGLKVTLLHVIIKVMADILSKSPDINGRIVFGKYLPYDKVDISCLVDIDGGKDLAVAVVEDADKKQIEDITEYLAKRAEKIKKKEDAVHKQQTSLFKLLPSFVISFVLEFLQLVGIDLGIDVPQLNIKKFMFGGALITNIGALGVNDAFAPFTPFARVPFLLTVCAARKKPVVKNDQIVIADICDVNFTIDHRYLDGGRVKRLLGDLDSYFNNPWAHSRIKKSE